MTFPRRGEIHLVEFDPSGGREIQTPVITSTVSAHPVTVPIAPTHANGLSVPSKIHLGQIRSVDRQRLVKRLGVVDRTIMRRVDDALKISLGPVEI